MQRKLVNLNNALKRFDHSSAAGYADEYRRPVMVLLIPNTRDY